MERIPAEWKDLHQSDVFRWTAKGLVCGGLYGTIMAFQHGLIGTRTARTMLLKSAFIIGLSAGAFPLTLQLYRGTLDNSGINNKMTVREAAVAGCGSGVVMGVLMGKWQAAVGGCLAGGSVAAFSTLLVNYKDLPATDHPIGADITRRS